MGLIDVLLRARWAQRILFLADRDALVEQALTDGFKAHLPSEPRTRIHTANIDKTVRLYVSTLQTMGRCYEKFSPAFFDLIIFDEAHRSIFNRFNEVIEYFDARMVGLTATPAAFIDRDTFRVFDCGEQTPTFLYTYEQAIQERRLVDFRSLPGADWLPAQGHPGRRSHRGRSQRADRAGSRPRCHRLLPARTSRCSSLTATRFAGSGKRSWNVCIKDRAGNLPGKTIIFAMTKAHANRIRDVFEEMFPQHVGVLQVIYHGVERVHDGPYGEGLITKFKKQDKPRIAVSVDMLDTGIDIPEVVNLVFMKPVQSRIKLWQMIGRGTRNQEACRYFDRLPGGEKTEFLIIDFWQNDFGSRPRSACRPEIPLLVRLFNTRLDILAATLNDRDGEAHSQAIADCRAMLSRIPSDSFLVRKVWGEVEARMGQTHSGSASPRTSIDFLRLKVAPFLRYVADVDVAAETFTNKVERLNLQILQGHALSLSFSNRSPRMLACCLNTC